MTTTEALMEQLTEAQKRANQLSDFLRASCQSPASKIRGDRYRYIARQIDLIRSEIGELDHDSKK